MEFQSTGFSVDIMDNIETKMHCQIHDVDFIYEEENGCPDCIESWETIEEEIEEEDYVNQLC